MLEGGIMVTKIEDAARWIVEEHADKKQFTSLPESFGIKKLSDAYQVQRKVVQLFKQKRGDVGGYKLALTSEPIQKLCGLSHPCTGYLFKSEILSGNRTISNDDFGRMAIEFELAIKIGSDLSSQKNPWDRQSILPHIEAVMPAFELVEDRRASYENLDILSIIADNCWSGGTVIGEPCYNWKNLDFDRLEVEKDINGEKEFASTGKALGNPFNSVVWMANFFNNHKETIQAGDILMTGSTFASHFASKGDRLEYRIDQIGNVKVEIA
jgi:2-keto-4-pentenoate hydratase